MDREPIVGEVVVVTKSTGRHDVTIGERLIVCNVDSSDDTFQGTSNTSKSPSTWIPFSDAEPVRFGWEFARAHLPADVVALLDACEGIEFIALSPLVKEKLLEALPEKEWLGKVTSATQSLDAMEPCQLTGDDDGDDDDCDDDCDSDDDDVPF